MATESITNKIAAVDKIYDEVNRGQTATSILRLLEPLMEARLGQLLNEFEKCPPDLGALLDLRARIAEVWRIRRTLNDNMKLGLGAEKMLQGIMQTQHEKKTL